MNLERFHSILARTKADVEATRIQNLLNDLTNHLQQQVNNPADPNQQKQVGTVRTQIEEALKSAPTNIYPPTWKRTLEDLSLGILIGNNLLGAVEAAFTRNAITPQLALEAIQDLRNRVQKSLEAVTTTINGLDTLNVPTDELEPGHSEVIISIPRGYVDDDATKLGRQFAAVEKLLRPFAELATGHAQLFKVREISSTDFTIILTISGSIYVAAQVVKIVAEAVGSIIDVYAKIAQLRIMKATLKNMGFDNENNGNVVAALEDGVKKTIEKDLDQAAQILFDKYKNKVPDEGRSHEVHIHIRTNMKEMAALFDRGFGFETRMGKLPKPKKSKEGEEPAADTQEQVELREAFKVISEAHREQQRITREGEPILSLPEPDEEEWDDDAEHNKSGQA